MADETQRVDIGIRVLPVAGLGTGRGSHKAHRLVVPDHLVKAITAAVQSVDAGAVLEVDLAAHAVRIESANASAESLQRAIVTAGYTPELATAAPIAGAESGTSASRRCCCG